MRSLWETRKIRRHSICSDGRPHTLPYAAAPAPVEGQTLTRGELNVYLVTRHTALSRQFIWFEFSKAAKNTQVFIPDN